ncbi:MAG: hypothetical protein HPY46_00440 [Candidatus Aminicenantes bacterium]|nr:hypothetical protein [Candidatus Aminicenantes bacterium]
MKANLIISIILLIGAVLITILKLKEISEKKKSIGKIFVQWYASGLVIFPFNLVISIALIFYAVWLYHVARSHSSGFYYALSSLSIIIFVTALLHWSTFCSLGSGGFIIRNKYYPREIISRLVVDKSKIWYVMKIYVRTPGTEREPCKTLLFPKKKLTSVEEFISLAS